MTTKQFDPSVPRRMYWADQLKNPLSCPECGQSLVEENHLYIIAAQEKDQINSFASRNDGGHFCPHCPVVVLENAVFNAITSESKEISRFQVMGIIDESKTTDDHIAITQFLSNKPSVKHGDKIGRNDLCPCRSGKKYKKCCLNKP